MDVRGGKLAINGVIADFGSETLRTVSGQSAALRPQAFAVLRYLAERAGRLVTKDELMAALWPGLAVSDDSLVQCIHEIRRALQDGDREVLKTTPKRGYRLMLPAEAAFGNSPDRSLAIFEPVAIGAGPLSSRAFAVACHGENLVERAKVAIAVLPFVNMSSDPEQEYFSDGITEDIITHLSRWHVLAVTSRNSSARFKGQRVDMRAVGRKLGVNFLVEGSVRRLAESIRITVQLIDARTGHHVWAERYDRPLTDLFAVQDEVVLKIAGTLVGRVYVSTAEYLRRKPPSDPAAYDIAMRANWLAWDIPSTRVEAKRCFEQAIELDPGYALPYSLLAVMLRYDWHRGFAGSQEILDRAFALARRGVELADHESMSHVAMGLLSLDRRCFDQAFNHMKRAIEINPANPALSANFGQVLCRTGRAEEGLELLREARRMDPFFTPSWYWPALGTAQFVLRRYREGLADFDQSTPRGADTSAMMAGCCAKLGLVERARALVTQCLSIQPEATIGNLIVRTVFKEASDSEHFAHCLRLAGMPE